MTEDVKDLSKQTVLERLQKDYGLTLNQSKLVYTYCLDAYDKNGKLKTLNQINKEIGYSSDSGAWDAMTSSKVKKAIDAMARDLPKMLLPEMINRKVGLARGKDAHGARVTPAVQARAIEYLVGIAELVAPKAKEQGTGPNKSLDEMSVDELQDAVKEIRKKQMNKIETPTNAVN